MAESSSSSVGDIPYMRMAEMYLIEAEARAQLGEDAAAATALHTLVSNRDPNYTVSTKYRAGMFVHDKLNIVR